MAKKTSRKFFLFGRYSLALLVPKKWLNELNVKRGDTVGLEFDRTRKRIVLRFGNLIVRENLKPSPKAPEKGSNSSDELKPIPQID